MGLEALYLIHDDDDGCILLTSILTTPNVHVVNNGMVVALSLQCGFLLRSPVYAVLLAITYIIRFGKRENASQVAHHRLETGNRF